MKNILILPGDGIGREVCDAALPIFDLLDLPIALSFGDIGWECWRAGGNPVPEKTWGAIESADGVLLGAITSKGKLAAENELIPALQGNGLTYVSPVIQLRQRLELFANIRPTYHLVGNRKPFRCVVIRENTEGLYAGMDRRGIPPSMREWVRHPNIDRSGDNGVAISVRLQTRFGLERLFSYAFNHARENDHKRVTFVDKPNVLRESGQFAADIFHAVAADYSEIDTDIQNVDAVALWLVRRPESFGVIVAENMFGDILSDLAGGVMGGLGVAPSANVGNRVCYFEPVHGSAPGMAGQGRANPSAMFLTIALMLRHLGFDEAAKRVEAAVRQVIVQGRRLTYDLGGAASTREMAQAILKALSKPQSVRRASILCIGDELLAGRVVNTNAAEIGRRLTGAGYLVGLQLTCGDQLPVIRAALDVCLGQSDLIVVNGGIGPTSDDLTRDALAAALERPLQFDIDIMHHIEKRLTGFGIKVDPSNRRQAMFPSGAATLPNPNGTAWGFEVNWQQCRLVVLPGPPRECLPMLERILAQEPPLAKPKHFGWMLLGVIESDIAAEVERILGEFGSMVEMSYLWRYPYVDVRVTLRDETDITCLATCLAEIDNYLAPYLVSKNGTTALALLKAELADRQWRIDDGITDHALTRRLPALTDSPVGSPIRVKASANRALGAPWSGVLSMKCEVQIGDEPQQCFRIDVPHRGPEVVDYACEFVAWSMLRSLYTPAANGTFKDATVKELII
jgi:isocitrate dehydrogenase